MDTSLLIETTDFNDPQQVVYQFIISCGLFKQRWLSLELDADAAEELALLVVRFYTTHKFHPYSSFAYTLSDLKNIKEIDRTVEISSKEQHIYTKSVRNLVPACLWKLSLKFGKWKITEIQRQIGPNKFYPLLLSYR